MINESEIKNYTVEMLVSEETIAQLYGENDETRRAILTALMEKRAKELDFESGYKRVISAANKADKQLANEYSRDYARQNQRIPLAIDGRGNPMLTIDNFLLIMRNDEYYSGLKYNLLTNAPEWSESGRTRRWTDADEAESRHYIEKEYFLHHREKHLDALSIMMREREYHPIRDIINAVEWDGTERIPGMLHKWMKCENTDYTQEVSRLVFAGGINRLYVPGCKFDDMAVLIGTQQGEGKSTFTRWLGIDDKYHREVSEIEGQKGIEAISGAWICEIGELLAITKAREKDAVKAYLSKQSDVYRKPWGRNVEEILRQCIFVGTTNRAEFLTDDKNRRYYPVMCASSGYELYDNEQQVRAEILQCWAEAREKMLRGEMPAYANRELLPEIREQQEQATEDDWRIGAIEKFLETKPIGYLTCIRELKREALAENPEMPKDPTAKESQEINVMMQGFPEWEKTGRLYTRNYGRQRCWKRKSKHISQYDNGNFVDVDELPDF